MDRAYLKAVVITPEQQYELFPGKELIPIMILHQALGPAKAVVDETRPAFPSWHDRMALLMVLLTSQDPRRLILLGRRPLHERWLKEHRFENLGPTLGEQPGRYCGRHCETPHLQSTLLQEGLRDTGIQLLMTYILALDNTPWCSALLHWPCHSQVRQRCPHFYGDWFPCILARSARGTSWL